MRNIRLFFFVGIVLFFGGQSLYSQSKKEREEQKAKEIKEMIENGRFTIEDYEEFGFRKGETI